jgi:hypothetical protein
VSAMSEAGKREWRARGPGYPAELRERIERQAAADYARWQAKGHPPVWFRLKSAARGAWLKTPFARRR